ncbi:MAG: hypothetical protein HC822_11485 [Oscillochloris sp.]|nr:hypothetical protein [Oscillochloris sp.]
MQLVQRQLVLGPHRIDGDPAAVDAPYIVAGRRMYALGYGSTRIGPIGDEHLVGLMGGIWAHPARVADGFEVQIRDQNAAVLAPTNARLTEQLTTVCWDWQSGDWQISRRDSILPDAPVYVLQCEVQNNGSHVDNGKIVVRAALGFLGCWFGGIASGAAHYRQSGSLVLGQDGLHPEWGIALGAAENPDRCTITPFAEQTLVELEYRFSLAPGERFTHRILLAVGLSGGSDEAAELWQRQTTQPSALRESGRFPRSNQPQLTSEHHDLTRDVALAQANLELLSADYPDLGPYFLAGLPEYPQLFGCDTTYSIPGAVAAGYAATARAALETLANYAARACGRVPHELTTNGRIFNPGNIQETPQFTIALWDYVRWSGDLDLARDSLRSAARG